MLSWFSWLTNERLRLGLLLTVLVVLITYAATSRAGLFGLGDSVDAIARDCPVPEAPEVATVARERVLELRRDLHLAMALYDEDVWPHEEGLASGLSAWSDDEPGDTPVRDEPRLPGGFEVRWFTLGNHVVADAFLFADTEQAREYVERAASASCRFEAVEEIASHPPRARNLEWENPVALAQQDVFLQRGRRAYRVAVVRWDAAEPTSEQARAGAFALVNDLACHLPEAGCPGVRSWR